MLPIHRFLFFTQNNYEGVYFFTAILASFIYFTILAKMENIDLDRMYEASFYGLLAALICGRLFSFVFWYPDTFFHNPLIFFNIKEGGTTITGAILGGLSAGFIYARIKKLSFLYHMRIFIPVIVLGHIIGRFGCFLNGDAGGIPTNLPWGVVFDPHSVAYIYTGIQPGTHVHPTQLYEMAGNLILFVFMILTGNNEWITRRRFIWYVMGYTTVRFLVEFLRADVNRFSAFPALTSGQIICLACWILGLAVLIWSIYNDKMLDVDEKYIARPVKKND